MPRQMDGCKLLVSFLVSFGIFQGDGGRSWRSIPSKARIGIAALTFAAVVMPLPAAADTFVFSTGNPDGLMATAARPDSPGKFEIETGDDFVLTQQTLITGAAFTGLIPLGASTSDIKNVVVEMYRVFPRGF